MRHDDECLHLGQMRSPAHSLVNGRRQERQLRTLGSMTPSGAGFAICLMKGTFSTRSGVYQEDNQISRVGKVLLSNSR